MKKLHYLAWVSTSEIFLSLSFLPTLFNCLLKVQLELKPNNDISICLFKNYSI